MDIIWNFFRHYRDRYFWWISQHKVTNKRWYVGYKNNLYGTKGTFNV
jgi:hypothetical protein